MSYRFMRMVLFFDLPVESSKQRSEYTRFRKFLIRNGFIMMQMSVYSKIALNQTSVDSVVGQIKKNKPKEGLVQVLIVTEKQFQKMEFLVGEKNNCVIDSDERLTIL